jgi:hypothetical protein
VASLEAPGDRERVLPAPAHAVWAAGHLLYSTADGTLVAQPFDHHRRRPTGEPAPVASTLEMRRWPTDVADGLFSASPGGVLAYREVTPQRQTRLTWLDRGGKPLGTLGEPADYEQMALSPDGRHVAAEVVDPRGGIDLWTFDAARGVASRVTTGPADERDPVWLPGSQELMFSDGEAGGRLLRKGLGTGTSASPVLEGAERYIPESLTPDGRMLLASSPHFQGLDEFTVWAIPLDGEEAPEALLQSEFLLDEFQVSPDGRWLSYISEESGDMEVYIEPFRRPGERVRVSVAGGGQPRWRADGRELYYGAPGAMMAVTVEDAESRVEIGTPRQLFEAPPMRPGYDDYAVTRDGQRFLVKVPIGEDPEPRFHVVVNWPSLLE